MALKDNLHSYWPMNEVSGNAIDIVGVNTALDINGVTSEIKPGSGLVRSFNRSLSQHLRVPDNNPLSPGNTDFSWAVWIKGDWFESGTTRTIFAKWGTSPGNHREYWLRWDSSVFRWMVSADGLGFNHRPFSGTPAAGIWNLLVCYHDSINDLLGASINGGAFVTTAHSTGIYSGTADFGIGSRLNVTADNWGGLIGPLGYWNRVLQPTDVTELWNGGTPLPASAVTGIHNINIGTQEIESAPVAIPLPLEVAREIRAVGVATGEIGTLLQTVSLPCTGEITSGGSYGYCTAEIAVGAPDPPTNAKAVHLGHGKVVINWQHANPERVRYFEVYAGFANGGPYFRYPTPLHNSTTTFLTNVPLGTTIFLQVRAVGHNGLASAFSSVKRGVFSPIEETLQVRAVSGTVINAGVRFSALHPQSSEPITFKAVNPILVN